MTHVNTTRRLLHTRSVQVRVYERDDGAFDVEAQLEDLKTLDMALASGIRPAGTPVHHMRLHLVVDRAFNILEAGSRSDWVPYAGHCEAHGDAYAQLKGLNLLRGFRPAVQARLGSVRGCTHLTELTNVLPTAVLQAFAGHVIDTHEGPGDGQAPFQLDRCHALRRDGPVVQAFYPRWHLPTPNPESQPTQLP